MTLDPATIAEARRRTAAATTPEAAGGTKVPPDPSPTPVDLATIGDKSPMPERIETSAADGKLAAAIASRSALRGAVTRMKTRASDEAPVLAAIEAGDETAVLTGLVGLAIQRFLESELGRDDTTMAAWSSSIEHRLQDAVYADSAAVGSLPADTPDLGYLRALATEAATPSAIMHGIDGRPSRNRPSPISLLRIVLR